MIVAILYFLKNRLVYNILYHVSNYRVLNYSIITIVENATLEYPY